jgi:hypothetical protein
MPIILAFILSLAATPAYAGLLFEPYGGYSSGDYKVTYAATYPDAFYASKNEKGTISGVVYGGRLAWMFDTFFLGGDYEAMRGTYNPQGEGESPDWESTSIFGIVGWQLQMGFRIYAGMTVQDQKSTRTRSDGENVYSGSARKVGIGYRYSVPIAINAEYIEYKFSKSEYDGAREPMREHYDRFKYSAVVVAVSFPFDIGGGGTRTSR